MRKTKLLLILSLLLTLFGCSTKLEVKDLSIEEQPIFGGIYIHLTEEEFNELGFANGDSLDFSFSNGYELNDIPYYDGFYVRANRKLLVSYPSYPYICLTICSGGSMYEESNVDEDTTVDIKLNQKAKYLNIQESLKAVYTNDRSDYESDEEFANFRCIEGGELKPNLLYRSASPCDNTYNRASTVSSLLEKHNIQTVLDITDSIEEIKELYNDPSLDSLYWKKLYENNHIFTQKFSAGFESDDFKSKVNNLVKTIIDNDGPYLVHCLEGKDRTGFICALLEALMGFNSKEIEEDYMKTYVNYYGMEKDSSKYNATVEVKFMDIIECIENNKESLKEGAKDYLISSGLTNEDIDKLILKLAK